MCCDISSIQRVKSWRGAARNRRRIWQRHPMGCPMHVVEAAPLMDLLHFLAIESIARLDVFGPEHRLISANLVRIESVDGIADQEPRPVFRRCIDRLPVGGHFHCLNASRAYRAARPNVPSPAARTTTSIISRGNVGPSSPCMGRQSKVLYMT